MFRPCFVIPSYNHHDQVDALLTELQKHDLAICLVDDGSDNPTRDALKQAADKFQNVELIRHEINQGKGAAVITGLRWAAAHQFTHMLQIDADGQHDWRDIGLLLETARQNPNDLISGKPLFDQSMPTGRKIGRWVTHIWVWIETLSLEIKDSMCGFRVYPLAETLDLLQSEAVGQRMDFDTDIMVRLYWRGVRTIPVETRVIYPVGNRSNFRMRADNVLISWMHTRLFLGMLFRLPRWMAAGGQWKKPDQRDTSNHWADIEERGLASLVLLTAWCLRIFGRRFCLLMLAPSIVTFYLTGRRQRQAALQFLKRVREANHDPRAVRLWDGLGQFFHFAQAALDKAACWNGDISPRDITLGDGRTFAEEPFEELKGAILMVSHLGNAELLRALSDFRGTTRVNALVHTVHSRRFAAALAKINPRYDLDLFEVGEVGPDTAIILNERLSQREIVVIAADRLAVGERLAYHLHPFLGVEAPFPDGPIRLANVLDAPVFFLACVRDGGKFRLIVKKLVDRVELSRKNREADIIRHQHQFVRELENLARIYPGQWFNFYDFWALPEQRVS